MRDVIKKILKEEEGLNWIKNVNPLKYGDYFIDTYGLSRNEKIELQQKLLDLGFRWGDNSRGVLNSDGPDKVNTWAINTLQGYTTDGSKNRIYYSIEPYDETTRRWLKYLSYDDFLKLTNENINEDFDWIKNVNPTEEIVRFTEDRIGKTSSGRITLSSGNKNRKLHQLFDTWHSALNFLQGDAHELAQFADNVNNETWSVEDRLESLNMMRDYINMGSMITDAKRALEFFRPLLGSKSYTLNDILTTLTEYYNKKI